MAEKWPRKTLQKIKQKSNKKHKIVHNHWRILRPKQFILPNIWGRSFIGFFSLSKNRPLADSFIELRCPSVCLFVPFHVLDFEAYFAPTSRSRLSQIFRDSESLGKSNGKKWSQNWNFLLGSGLESPRKKS